MERILMMKYCKKRAILSSNWVSHDDISFQGLHSTDKFIGSQTIIQIQS